MNPRWDWQVAKIVPVPSTKFLAFDQFDPTLARDFYEAQERPRPRSRMRCHVAPLVATVPGLAWAAIREAIFAVSPHRSNTSWRCLMIPATTGPK